MKKTLLIACMALHSYGTAFAQEIARSIDSLVTSCYEAAEFTGAVLVAKAGKVLLKRSYGVHDDYAIFNIASITKPFTAALIMKLQEAGKLSVQDKLSKYYPDFPNAGRITIHQLLTHTSGVFNYLDDPAFRKLDQTKVQTLTQMIGWFKDKPLNFEPGTKFQYSNSGYTLLGYIIEQVTGTSYAKALALYIFKPLRLRHTSYGPPTDTSHLTKGYAMYYRNFKLPAPAIHPSISYATGAIYSTVEDLYTFHTVLQKGKFLSKASLQAMYTKDKGVYGYGWFIDSMYGKQRVVHDGKIAGYKSILIRFPQDDVCIIALSNANSSGGDMIGNIMNLLYHQPMSKPFAELPVIDMPDSLKKEFTGTYKYENMQVSIRWQDSNLYILIPGNNELPLQPVKRNVFRAGNARVEFMRDSKGFIQKVFVYRKGTIFGADKVN